MLPMRPMTPAQASIASLSVVLPDDAWPTMAKFRRSPAEGVAITQICSCSKHASNSPRTQAQIFGWLRRRFAIFEPDSRLAPMVALSMTISQTLP
jgi:hypothetical protein